MDTILYGPAASGKTYRSKEIAKKLGHMKIVDGATEQDLKEHYGKNVLFITNEPLNSPMFDRRKYKLLSISDI